MKRVQLKMNVFAQPPASPAPEVEEAVQLTGPSSPDKQGPEIPTTGNLPEGYSEIWENMGKWGKLGEDLSFPEN